MRLTAPQLVYSVSPATMRLTGSALGPVVVGPPLAQVQLPPVPVVRLVQPGRRSRHRLPAVARARPPPRRLPVGQVVPRPLGPARRVADQHPPAGRVVAVVQRQPE